MLPAFSLIGLLTWSFWFVRAISEGWKQWGSMSLNEAWKGFSIRVTFINLKAGPGRIKIYSFVPYQWEMTWNTLKKLSCFWEEDMITYLYSSTSVFFVWRALLPWMAKPSFFFPSWLHSRSTWPAAEIWLWDWDLGSATCVYIFYQNEGSLFRIPEVSGMQPVNRDITL